MTCPTVSTTACQWDSIIPLEPLWGHYDRVCKDDGVIVLTASQPFTTTLISSNIKNFRYEWIWEKPQGTNPLLVNRMPLKNHESILVFYKKTSRYYPQMEQGTPYGSFHSNDATIGEAYGSLASTHRDNPDGTRFPKTVLKFPQDKGYHPTQKPVSLMEYLIKTYTKLGEIVLDNTMGSGTTGVACMNVGREFIGIEKDEKYFQIAKDRIEEAQQLTAFLEFEEESLFDFST